MVIVEQDFQEWDVNLVCMLPQATGSEMLYSYNLPYLFNPNITGTFPL